MIATQATRRILWVEVLGFAAILLVLCLDELVDLPRLLLNAEPTPVNWAEMVVEALFVLVLAAFTTGSTKHLMMRVKHLEGGLPLCCFCRKIHTAKGWIPVEEYIESHSQAEFHSSLCMECLLDIHMGTQTKHRAEGEGGQVK